MDTPNITPTPEQETEALTLNLEGVLPEKNIKKWPVITALIVALLAVITVIAVFVFKGLDQTPDSQKVITIVDVERQAGGGFDLSGFTEDAPVGKTADIRVDINDLALKLIQNQLPDLAFLGQLDGLAVYTTFERNNGMTRIALDLDMGEEASMPVEIILDDETQSVYIASEMFNDHYLKFDISSMEGSEDDWAALKFWLEVLMNSEMTDRYFNNFLELMTSQESKTEILTVNGVSQQCTVYTSQISQEALCGLVIDLLEELKECKSEYAKVMDALIEQIEESLEDETKTLCWSVYTDNSGKIIGREISLDDECLFSYMLTTDKEDIGFKCAVASFVAQGNAVVKDGMLEGTFILSEDEVDYLKVGIEKFDLEAYKKGILNGTVELEPTDELISLLFNTKISLPVSISVDFEGDETKQTVELSLMDMVTLTIDLTNFEPGTISLPEGTEINGEDTDALSRLFGANDLDVAV